MDPEIRTVSIRSFMRFMQRSRVDLPQPDGPIRAVTSPRGTSMVISNSAWTLSYHRLKSRTDTMVPSPESRT